MSVVRLDVAHGVADGLEVLDLVVRDLDAELLLGGHHDLDMDSESTSRSSVKDFPSATSSGFTPATSSRISARPEVISSRVAMLW